MKGGQQDHVSDWHSRSQVEESSSLSLGDSAEDCVGPSWDTCPSLNPTLCSGMVRNDSLVRPRLMPILLEGRPDRC